MKSLPLPNWTTLEEAVDYLTEKLDERWTIGHVMDAGNNGLFSLRGTPMPPFNSSRGIKVIRKSWRVNGKELEAYVTTRLAEAEEITTAEPLNGKVKATRGVTKQQVISAFEGLHFGTDAQWSKALADVPKWLASSRVAKGNKASSALWNPVQIAVALYDKNVSIKKLDVVFVRLKDWTDEWQAAREYLRE